MSGPKAYVIAHVDVTDPDKYVGYTDHTPAVIAAAGGRYIVRGGRADVREGSARSRHVVIEFPDMAAAQAFYESEAYQALLPVALATSEREFVIVEGVGDA